MEQKTIGELKDTKQYLLLRMFGLRKTRRIMAFVDALGIDVDSDWCCCVKSRER